MQAFFFATCRKIIGHGISARTQKFSTHTNQLAQAHTNARD
jgi:hypothetical protein